MRRNALAWQSLILVIVLAASCFTATLSGSPADGLAFTLDSLDGGTFSFRSSSGAAWDTTGFKCTAPCSFTIDRSGVSNDPKLQLSAPGLKIRTIPGSNTFTVEALGGTCTILDPHKRQAPIVVDSSKSNQPAEVPLNVGLQFECNEPAAKAVQPAVSSDAGLRAGDR